MSFAESPGDLLRFCKIKTLFGPHHRPNPKNFFQKGNKRREE